MEEANKVIVKRTQVDTEIELRVKMPIEHDSIEAEFVRDILNDMGYSVYIGSTWIVKSWLHITHTQRAIDLMEKNINLAIKLAKKFKVEYDNERAMKISNK